MPHIAFIADEHDARQIIEYLNADPEITFIVPDGPLDPEEAFLIRIREAAARENPDGVFVVLGNIDNGYRQRWRAVSSVSSLADGTHSLWHVPSGPLPLLDDQGANPPISDPWLGWTEKRQGFDPTAPYFAGHSGVIGLTLWARHKPYSEEERKALWSVISYWNGTADILVASSFGWTGDRFGASSPETKRWWERLKRWVKRSTVRLHDPHITSVSFHAFPSALERLKEGIAYSANGLDLDQSIRDA